MLDSCRAQECSESIADTNDYERMLAKLVEATIIFELLRYV